MKEIQLTQGKLAIVDDEDFDRVRHLRWYAIKNRNIWYAVHEERIGGKRILLRLHSFIRGMPMTGSVIDHSNGDGLDNRRSNLRILPYRLNSINSTRHRNGKVPGVGFDKRRKFWYSRIFVNSKRLFLGSFETEKDAAIAYQNALASVS